MLRHKYIDRVCCVVLALTVLVSGLFVGAAASGVIAADTSMGYESRLFDQSRVHTIDIVMQDWEAFLDTATSEEYSACHLVIDGESYKNVAIRGKGNTSLSSVATYGNDRYSFKVEFDHYQTGHTYYGLDKLSLNNLIQDNTYLKDYLAYTLMNKMGVAAPLCSFVQINVNGEPWGLYLAVEGVEDAFLQRNYGKDHGELYKPDSMSFGGGRGNGRDFDMDEVAEKFGFSFGDGEDGESTFTIPDMSDIPTMPEGFDPSEMTGSFGGSSGGQAATAQPTATATPEPTATPMPSPGMGGDGGSAGASSGMPAGGEAPAMPTDGAMDGASSGMPAGGEAPAMPTDGTMDSASSGMPAMPDASAQPQASASPETPSAPGGMMPDMSSFQLPEGMEMPDMGGFGGGFGMGSDDVKLVYSDDDPSSYSNIFNNAKTDVTAADQARLIAAIKALNEGDTSAVDTDEVIRYMAVHNFLCNDDSYTGMMVHNYYLYEEDGVLEMIPWDYNLAYGGFSGGMGGNGATSTVNTTISRLVSNGSDSDRPMAGWITANEEYMAQYLDMYREFMATAFDSGWFSAEFDRVRAMIDPYVQADPTAFCTYEEFQTAADTLKAFCLKRAQSVNNQLRGDSTRVDASELDLSVMGTMNNGGGFGGGPGGDFGGFGSGRPEGGRPDSTDDAKPDTTPDAAETAQTPPPAENTVPEEGKSSRDDFSGDFAFPGRGQQTNTNRDAWVWVAACVLLLGAAIILVKTFKTNR